MKKVFWGGGVALGVFVFWWCGMNYTGYCHSQGRYLSNEEKIRSAVDFTLNRYPPTISRKIKVNVDGVTKDTEERFAPKNPIKYSNIDEFIKLNPDCCTLSMRTREGGRPYFLDRITGYVSTYVLILFKVRYFNENNIENYSDSGMAVAIQNCGKSWSGL
jgi:hypothetical protein